MWINQYLKDVANFKYVEHHSYDDRFTYYYILKDKKVIDTYIIVNNIHKHIYVNWEFDSNINAQTLLNHAKKYGYQICFIGFRLLSKMSVNIEGLNIVHQEQTQVKTLFKVNHRETNFIGSNDMTVKIKDEDVPVFVPDDNIYPVVGYVGKYSYMSNIYFVYKNILYGNGILPYHNKDMETYVAVMPGYSIVRANNNHYLTMMIDYKLVCIELKGNNLYSMLSKFVTNNESENIIRFGKYILVKVNNDMANFLHKCPPLKRKRCFDKRYIGDVCVAYKGRLFVKNMLFKYDDKKTFCILDGWYAVSRLKYKRYLCTNNFNSRCL